MSDQAKARAEASYQQPFTPAGPSVTAEYRAAYALEYIAAQLGMIRAAMEENNERERKNDGLPRAF